MRKRIHTREDAYAWLSEMCDPSKEDLEKFIEAIMKTGCYGLDRQEQELLKECSGDIVSDLAEKIFLEEEE